MKSASFQEMNRWKSLIVVNRKLMWKFGFLLCWMFFVFKPSLWIPWLNVLVGSDFFFSHFGLNWRICAERGKKYPLISSWHDKKSKTNIWRSSVKGFRLRYSVSNKLYSWMHSFNLFLYSSRVRSIKFFQFRMYNDQSVSRWNGLFLREWYNSIPLLFF